MTEQEGVFGELRLHLLELFRRGVEEPLSEDVFNELALRVFRFQCGANRAYGAFVQRRGVKPEGIGKWEEIPPVPTGAFKTVSLVAGEPERCEAVFRTSGTTRGRKDRGRHCVRSLDLYRAALLPNFRHHLLPGEGRPPVLALLPDPVQAPDSSLSFMVGEVKDRLLGGRGGFFADPETGVRAEAFHGALEEAVDAGEPVLLAGTAFAFVHWLEAAGKMGWVLRLPEGSRIMETGGFKGRSRALPRERLYLALENALGVPAHAIVNEYGMTELLSQFYEPVFAVAGGNRAGGGGEVARSGRDDELAGRYHRGPPWVRTRVLHPLTLEPVPHGDVGILAHLDLANLGSVSAILTEDLGRLVGGGFRLHGRSPGAEPRGCSLAMEDFLAGVEGGTDAF